MAMLGAVVIGANILIWSEEPRPEVRFDRGPRPNRPETGARFRPACRRLSQLFTAFVWDTLAHMAAQKRRSVDKTSANQSLPTKSRKNTERACSATDHREWDDKSGL